MMQKVKLKKYTISLFVCFLSFFGIVSAATTVKETKTWVFTHGASMFISNDEYKDLSCPTANLGGFVINKSTSGTKGYLITYKNKTTEERAEKLVCTWSGKNAAGSVGNVNGKTEYTLKVDNKTEVLRTKVYNVNSDESVSGKTYDIWPDLQNEYGAKKIVNSTVSNDGKENINVNCSSGSTCKVTYTSAADEGNDELKMSYIAIRIIVNENGTDVEKLVNVQFVFNIYNGARAYPGGSGTCDFNDKWKYTQWDDIGSYKFYQTFEVESAKLPNCKSNNDFLVFKGWKTGDEHGEYNQDSHVMAIGECTGAISSGTKPIANKSYAACYEMKPYVQLAAGEGNIDNTSGKWKQIKADMSGLFVSSGYYYVGNNTTDTIKLPSVKFTGFLKNTKFKGWKNKTTGEMKNAGDTVTLDGSVWEMVYERQIGEVDRNKTVYVNEEVILSSTLGKTTACKSENTSYVTARVKNNKCILKGQKVTTDKIKVALTVEGQAEPVEYLITVIDKTGQSSGGNNDFIINTTPNVIIGKNDETSTSSDILTSTCDTFDITFDQKVNFGSSMNVAESITLSSWRYTAKSDCDGKEYMSLCLDPGRPMYNGNKFKKVEDINPNSDFGIFISYIIQKINDLPTKLADVNSEERVAVHIASRIVALQNGYSAGYDTSDKLYWNLYEPYEKIADAISSGTSVQAALDTYISFTSSGIRQKVITYLSEYSSFNTTGDSQNFENKIGPTEAVADGNGYRLIYTGELVVPSTIPNGASLSLEKCEGRNGISCKVLENLSGSGNTRNYKVEIKVDDASTVKLPATQEEKKKIAFKLKINSGDFFSLQNVFIAEAVSNKTLQRMLLFDLNTQEYYIYLDIANKKLCKKVGVLDPSRCTAADNCNNFNVELFKKSECCSEITDESKNEYIINKICNGNCTSSNFVSVCEFNPSNVGKSDIYTIKEGAYVSGAGYSDSIGTCIANVSDKYDKDNKAAFMKTDDNGNLINVDKYNDNLYCQVTCKEDWQLTMDAFGNFVGKKAVAAGTYFEIENDIFMGGKRTCYTSYIDYEQYMTNVRKFSEAAINAYNKYAHDSHVYSDIKEQTYTWASGSGGTFTCEELKICSEVKAETKSECKVPNSSPGVVIDTSKFDCYNSSKPDATKNSQGHNGISETKETGNYLCETWGETYYNCTLKTDSITESGKYTPYKYSANADGSVKWEEDSQKSYSASLSTGCACSSTENGFCVAANSECGVSKSDQFTNLRTELLESYEGKVKESINDMTIANQKITTHSEHLFKCQHFQLVNETDAKKGRTPVVVAQKKLLGNYREYEKINTSFDPIAAYTYDEKAFMTIVGKNNVLVENKEANDAAGCGNYDTASNCSKEVTLYGGTKVNISRNKAETKYFDPNTMWISGSPEAETYGNGGGDSSPNTQNRYIVLCTNTSNTDESEKIVDLSESNIEWKSNLAGCYKINVTYEKEHYISSSLENSSFYKNKGNWWVNGADVKEHGENFENALSNAGNRGVHYDKSKESGNWTKLGSYNVFPVSMTTPRNLYQYTYTFGNIGSYKDGTLGRIMGNSDSIITLNSRTCFYEVYEEICLCCGDEINTYTDNEGLVNEFLDGAFDYNQTLIEQLNNGEHLPSTMTIATSSFSLSDVYSKNVKVSDNWSKNSIFTYENKVLKTNKGDELLKAIESKGENIYNEKPEYSYYLTPSTLSSIREYNDTYGYEVNYNNLKVYGRYKIAGSIDNSLTKEQANNSINFRHYGSKFLEDFMSSYAVGKTLATSKNNNVCSITDSGVVTASQLANNGGTCRWVDYIEKDKTGDRYRLAFK